MNKLQNYVIWLDGFLDAKDGQDLTANDTLKIREKLNALFDHEPESLGITQNNKILLVEEEPTKTTDKDVVDTSSDNWSVNKTKSGRWFVNNSPKFGPNKDSKVYRC